MEIKELQEALSMLTCRQLVALALAARVDVHHVDGNTRVTVPAGRVIPSTLLDVINGAFRRKEYRGDVE